MARRTYYIRSLIGNNRLCACSSGARGCNLCPPGAVQVVDRSTRQLLAVDDYAEGARAAVQLRAREEAQHRRARRPATARLASSTKWASLLPRPICSLDTRTILR